MESARARTTRGGVSPAAGWQVACLDPRHACGVHLLRAPTERAWSRVRAVWWSSMRARVPFPCRGYCVVNFVTKSSGFQLSLYGAHIYNFLARSEFARLTSCSSASWCSSGGSAPGGYCLNSGYSEWRRFTTASASSDRAPPCRFTTSRCCRSRTLRLRRSRS